MMDWPVYLINLDKDRARLEAATAELARAGTSWQRIPAVNGRLLSAEEVAAVYDGKANRRYARHPLTGPEIGCYLSHLRAWAAIRASGQPGGVVLEDDIRISGDLPATLRALAADDGTWDIAKLFSFRHDVTLLHERSLAPGLRLGTPYRVPSTTLAYAIRAEAAHRLLRLSQPFFRPIDEDHKFFWEKRLAIVQVDPLPVAMGKQDTSEGTVGEARRSATRGDPRTALMRAWTGMRYQASYAAGLHLRRLRQR
ncbi:MAG: glycosyltransferase family 25 protein [Pseudomonadota bacterium]